MSPHAASPHHHAPADCPVCGERLLLTRVSCEHCHTELSGRFVPCGFCALTDDERDLLREFLASRGNVRHLSRHLGVSYPTARARLDDLRARLGLADPAEPDERLTTLQALARGELDVDEAESLLDGA